MDIAPANLLDDIVLLFDCAFLRDFCIRQFLGRVTYLVVCGFVWPEILRCVASCLFPQRCHWLPGRKVAQCIGVDGTVTCRYSKASTFSPHHPEPKAARSHHFHATDFAAAGILFVLDLPNGRTAERPKSLSAMAGKGGPYKAPERRTEHADVLELVFPTSLCGVLVFWLPSRPTPPARPSLRPSLLPSSCDL